MYACPGKGSNRLRRGAGFGLGAFSGEVGGRSVRLQVLGRVPCMRRMMRGSRAYLAGCWLGRRRRTCLRFGRVHFQDVVRTGGRPPMWLPAGRGCCVATDFTGGT